MMLESVSILVSYRAKEERVCLHLNIHPGISVICCLEVFKVLFLEVM